MGNFDLIEDFRKDTLKVIICGGRDYPSELVLKHLDKYFIDDVMEGMSEIIIIHGNAKGADTGGRLWGEKYNLKVIKFPADWKKHGNSAGPIRNQQMIDEGMPELVIAFPGGEGTKDMVSRTQKANIRLVKLGKYDKKWSAYA